MKAFEGTKSNKGLPLLLTWWSSCFPVTPYLSELIQATSLLSCEKEKGKKEKKIQGLSNGLNIEQKMPDIIKHSQAESIKYYLLFEWILLEYLRLYTLLKLDWEKLRKSSLTQP